MNSFRRRSRARWRCVRVAFALAALGASPVAAAPSFVIEDGACDTAAMARHLARLAETSERPWYLIVMPPQVHLRTLDGGYETVETLAAPPLDREAFPCLPAAFVERVEAAGPAITHLRLRVRHDGSAEGIDHESMTEAPVAFWVMVATAIGGTAVMLGRILFGPVPRVGRPDGA